ncbi:MAG TPA: RsmD family RNA methyltransferase, partial [Spirochaetota bacterium]|nr:RsmD family RNA methyltransferase [Spirochaetota bacterium]
MIRIISGKLKGRLVNFSNAKFQNAEITPQMMKEAFFSIISMEKNETFLDLFSCSGQIAFEAWSRGFNTVHAVELDHKRFLRLKQNLSSMNISEGILVHNIDADRFLDKCSNEKLNFDIIFIDPPYVKVDGPVLLYNQILEKIKRAAVLKPSALAVIQHFGKNVIEFDAEYFDYEKRRDYGSNSISFFRRKDLD